MIDSLNEAHKDFTEILYFFIVKYQTFPLFVAVITAILGPLGESAYIGMRYYQKFSWMDQTAVDYTNWDAGEPTSYVSITLI